MAFNIYTIGALDLAKDVPDWRNVLGRKLHDRGFNGVIFSPGDAYKSPNWGTYNPDRSRYIEDVNYAALTNSNLIVASVMKNIQSIGSSIELEFANKCNIPIILMSDIGPGSSVYLDNRVSLDNWITTDMGVDSTLDKVVDRIFKMDNGQLGNS